MRHETPSDLLTELRRLVALAGRDEQAALVGFHALDAVYDRAVLDTAVRAVTAEYFATARL
jgi:hypothetical protein